MHIAYLTPEYPNPRLSNAGGMGTSIKNLVTSIISLGHQVTVIVYGQKEDVQFDADGISFHSIKQKRYSIGGFYFYRKHIESYVNKHTDTVDIIEAPDWTGITAFMNLKRPLVIRFHGSDTYFCHIEGRKQKRKNIFFESRAIKKAKAFIAPTHFAGEVSMDLFKQPLKKLKIIHYGLELEKFTNVNPENYESKRLLNIGTLIRKKGVFQLVKIFNAIVEIHPDASLYFVGADSSDIKTGANSTWELMQAEMTDASKKNIHYLGKIPYQDIQEYIKKAHICLFPSLAETLGMVTIESMALHKAVINTNLGWAQDIINDGKNGFMYHPDDIEGYLTSINNLFSNAELVQKIGNSARKRVESTFDITKIANDNIDYYQEVVNKL